MKELSIKVKNRSEVTERYKFVRRDFLQTAIGEWALARLPNHPK